MTTTSPLRAPQLWQVLPSVALGVAAPPSAVLAALDEAAHPSQTRLHHRDLFVEGRRYYLRPHAGGFELRSDSKTRWHRKRRTGRAAVLVGSFGAAGEVTTLRLRGRLRTPHLFVSLLFPLWMAALVIATPWSLGVTTFTVAALLLLALAAAHFEAALQAHDMIVFVRKALEELPAAEQMQLVAANEVIINPVQRDFRAEWERYYEDRREG
jgi:hypothetical protein